MLSVYAARVIISLYLPIPIEVTINIIKYYEDAIKPTKKLVKQIIDDYENPIYHDYMFGWTHGLNALNQHKYDITINTKYVKGPAHTYNNAFRHLDYNYRHEYVYNPLTFNSTQSAGWMYTLFYMRYYTDQIVRV